MEKNVLYQNDKKFIWDGLEYNTESEAKIVAAEYQQEDFETSIINNKEFYFIYSRRSVKEIIVDGSV